MIKVHICFLNKIICKSKNWEYTLFIYYFFLKKMLIDWIGEVYRVDVDIKLDPLELSIYVVVVVEVF